MTALLLGLMVAAGIAGAAIQQVVSVRLPRRQPDNPAALRSMRERYAALIAAAQAAEARAAHELGLGLPFYAMKSMDAAAGLRREAEAIAVRIDALAGLESAHAELRNVVPIRKAP